MERTVDVQGMPINYKLGQYWFLGHLLNLGFTNFIAKAVDEGLTLYLSVFGGDDELVPLKELAGGTGAPYSQEYLSLLSRRGVLDAVKIRGVWHASKRTVRRYVEGHERRR